MGLLLATHYMTLCWAFMALVEKTLYQSEHKLLVLDWKDSFVGRA